MKYLYIILASLFMTSASAQFDVKLHVDNVNKRLRVQIRNTVSSAPTTSQNISSINMKLLGPKVDNIISIFAGNYTVQMPNSENIITMSSVSLPSPENWVQNQWYAVVIYNLTPGMEYTAADFMVQPDLDMDNSDVFDPIMSVQAAGLFNIPLNIIMTTLPVRLLKFEAKSDQKNVICEWVTDSEVNNSGYEIQRSRYGDKFEKIGWVDSKSNSNKKSFYEFVDYAPNQGKNYYRLKQIDLDETYWLSDIISVNMESKFNNISLYPNPVSGVLYVNGIDEGITVSIYSPRGKLLNTIVYNNDGIDISGLTKGLYYLSVKNGGDQNSKKFIIL